MKTWIAFLKSINVGGNNILPMKNLRSIGDSLGYEKFRTYIQSGNCVFLSKETDVSKISQNLADEIYNNFGFCPPIILLSVDELRKTIDLNPYKVEASEANKVHFHFVWSDEVKFDEADAKSLAIPSEKFVLQNGVLFLYAPDGVARSKLFAKLPKLLNDNVTVRNLKTVTKVYDLAVEIYNG